MIETKYFCDFCGEQVLVNPKDKEIRLRFWEISIELYKKYGNLGTIQNLHGNLCQKCKNKLGEQFRKTKGVN